LNQATQQALWITEWFKAIGIQFKQLIIVYGNNKPSIDIIRSNKEAVKIKHIQVEYHQLQEFVQYNEVNIEQVASGDNIADIFMKTFIPVLHTGFIELLGLNR